MKIKEGKRYVRRDGKITDEIIINPNTESDYPYKCPKGNDVYTKRGNYWQSKRESEYDLIKQHNPKVKYKVSKKFIKEAHSSACTQWKEKIEAEFPKLFPKKEELETGKWYHTNTGGLWFMTRILVSGGKEYAYGYGFYRDLKDWTEESTGSNLSIERLTKEATPKEVQTALISESLNKGFKEGIKYDPITEIGHVSVSEWEHEPRFTSNDDMQMFIGMQYIFKAGKWATIVEEPQAKQMTVAEVSKLAGCKVEIIE